MEWRMSVWRVTYWTLHMANSGHWYRAPDMHLWLFFTQNHSFQHFNSTWPVCPALAGGGSTCQWTISWVWGRSLPTGSEQFSWTCVLSPYCVLVHSIVAQSDKAFMQVEISKKSFLRKNSPLSQSLFLSKFPERRTKPTLSMSLQNHFPGNIGFTA